MKLNDCLILGFKNLFKKKTITNIFVIFISFLTILSILTIYNTISNFIEKNIENNIEYRTIFVKYDVIKDNLDNVIFKLSNVNHVHKVLEQNDFETNVKVTEFKTNKTNGEIRIIASDNESTPQIVLGRNLNDEDKNVLICPTKFIADGNIQDRRDLYKSDYIDGNDFLNKKVEVTYKSYDYSKEIPKVLKEYKENFEVIGLYDAYNNYSGENVCYTNSLEVIRINKIIEGNLEEYSSEVFWYPIVIVDNSVNVSDVISEITKIGYTPIKQMNIDIKLINEIKYVCYIITFIMIVMSFLSINAYMKKSINDRKEELGIYKTIGYSNKNILKTLLVETLLINIISFLLAITIYSILYFIANFIISHFSIIYSRFVVNFSTLGFIICLICIIITSCFCSLFTYKKIKLINPIDIINK